MDGTEFSSYQIRVLKKFLVVRKADRGDSIYSLDDDYQYRHNMRHLRAALRSDDFAAGPFLSFLTVKIMSNNNNNDNKYTNNSKAKEFITKTITKYTSMLKKTILSILFLLTISSLQSLNLEYKKWKNTNVLWTDAIKKNDNDYYAHHGLAENLAQKCTQNLKHCKIKNLKKAIYHMKKSMKVKVTNNID